MILAVKIVDRKNMVSTGAAEMGLHNVSRDNPV